MAPQGKAHAPFVSRNYKSLFSLLRNFKIIEERQEHFLREIQSKSSGGHLKTLIKLTEKGLKLDMLEVTEFKFIACVNK